MIERPDWSVNPPGALVPVVHPTGVRASDTCGSVALVEQRSVSPATYVQRSDVTTFANADAVDPSLLAEWNGAGGAGHRLAVASGAAASVAAPLSEEARGALDASVDELPASVRNAFIAELALGGCGSVRTASADDVRRFCELPEQAELARSWGGAAARNLGRVRARVSRIIGRLSEAEADAAWDWFDSLSPAAAKSVLRMLAR